MTTRVDLLPLPIVRRDGRRWLRLAMIFAACLVVADSLFGDRGLAARLKAHRDYRHAAQALYDLRQENAGLWDQVRRLRSDPAAIEAIAREELGMSRRGEILFVVVPAR